MLNEDKRSHVHKTSSGSEAHFVYSGGVDSSLDHFAYATVYLPIPKKILCFQINIFRKISSYTLFVEINIHNIHI